MSLFVKSACSLKIFVLFSFYFFISLTVAAFMVIIRFFLIPFQNLSEKFTLLVKRYWLFLTVSIFQFYFPFKTFIGFNKEILKKKRVIIISNHLTNWDWLICLIVLKELKMYDQVHIIMKEILRKIPIFGYGMKCFGYIFLKRDWLHDSEILKRNLEKIKKKDTFAIFLFPEGTFLDEESHFKSRYFAEKSQIIINNELYDPKNTLIPRITGINKIKEILGDKLDAIIDITLFITPYKKYLADEYSIKNIFFDQKEKPRFYLFIREIKNISDKNWLYKTFYEKEQRITNLIENVDKFESIEELNCFKSLFNFLFKSKFEVIYKDMKTKLFFLQYFIFIVILFFMVRAIKNFVLF